MFVQLSAHVLEGLPGGKFLGQVLQEGKDRMPPRLCAECLVEGLEGFFCRLLGSKTGPLKLLIF